MWPALRGSIVSVVACDWEQLHLTILMMLVLLGLSAVGVYWVWSNSQQDTVNSAQVARPSPASSAKQYVGANQCRQCHPTEFSVWQGSDHALAMQVANEKTVLGNFNDVTFEFDGVLSTFFKRDGHFRLRTDGSDGQLADHPVAYAFGVIPLQQD